MKPSRAEFQAWADEGYTARDVCALLGRSPTYVCLLGKEYGISLNKTGWGGNRKEGYTQTQSPILYRLPMPASGGRLSYYGRID